MPGTTKLQFYTMPLVDALTILMADKDVSLGMGDADADELRQAARCVVERHAQEVASCLASPPPAASSVLRVVTNGEA
jgi:hypothetical protein